jgi:hypothetical protein
VIAYGISIDYIDEYLRIGEDTTKVYENSDQGLQIPEASEKIY